MGTKTSPHRVDPPGLRKETREWLTRHTIPNARDIAKDLQNAGEDVHDLVAAIDELEALIKEDGGKTAARKSPKSGA